MGADSDDDEVLAVGFDNFDVLDGLEFAPVSSERPWVVAMDRCRAAAALPQRALARQQQVCFMKVLAELGGHRCHGDEMREAGVIDYAIDTVRGLDLHDPLDRPLLLWSCRAIRKVSCPNRLNRRRVRAAGGLPVLIPVLDCGEEPVVLECCHLFKNVCYGHGVARNEMRELGGVNALMRVLLTERFGNATWRAAVALCGLCWATPLNLELITSTPGVMEAIELRLGDKPPWKTAVGLKALRRHLALRTAGQGGGGRGGGRDRR
ncbi:hypothetical protein KFE25_002014 [Diacronema lutheri]|uniref:Uncharacterized protein n=1 Tax=Diacronema lutheri TaxID=2081491 RepID=A0A8J5XKC1_DIALT|nr:hypothetical protein KFE25_002014 [Diacronema lutheri]